MNAPIRWTHLGPIERARRPVFTLSAVASAALANRGLHAMLQKILRHATQLFGSVRDDRERAAHLRQRSTNFDEPTLLDGVHRGVSREATQPQAGGDSALDSLVASQFVVDVHGSQVRHQPAIRGLACA